MENLPKVSAVLLAAGLSRRLGRNKLLLPVGGMPLVRRAAAPLLGSKASEVIVVTGRDAGEIRAALGGMEVRFVHNPRHAEGQGTSLAVGLAAVGEEAEGILFALGDQPFLTAALVDRLIEAFGETRPRPLVVAPFLGERRGTPTLLSAELREALARMGGDEGARELVKRVRAEEPERFRAVPVEDERLLWDLDTEADYERLLAEAEGSAGERTPGGPSSRATREEGGS